LLRDMGPQTSSVRVFTEFGHWNQEDGILEGQPNWMSISDIIEIELQKCVDQATTHAEIEGMESMDYSILGKQNALEILTIIRSPAMDSEKTACLAAIIPQMLLHKSIADVLVGLGGWNHSTARFEGAPDWNALARSIESSNIFEPISAARFKRCFDEAPEWDARLDDAMGGPAVTLGAGAQVMAAPAKRAKCSKTGAISQEEWIAMLERVALGTD
jgi:hypothetical protein